MYEGRVMLPRHAFSLRDAPRAGDVWRAFQELAVDASTAAGWPPRRFRDDEAAFVVRSMRVRHDREPWYGEPLLGTTWVSRMQRQMFSTREVLIASARGTIARGTQEWVHVSSEIIPTKASAALLDAFPVERADDTTSELPEPARREESPAGVFHFTPWWTSMDPLGHANHPAYIDWCDEALSRHAFDAGVDPIGIVPVAEAVLFRRPVSATDAVTLESQFVGLDALGSAIFKHRLQLGTELAARATTVRRHILDAPGARSVLADLFVGASVHGEPGLPSHSEDP